MDFRHFAWAKSCNILRDDLTHLGDSFKLLITKIGDRPVGPYPWIRFRGRQTLIIQFNFWFHNK